MRKKFQPFQDEAVASKFASYPVAAQEKMLLLRQLILEVAKELETVGPMAETLKWGEPAYLTSKPGAGSTIRIDWKARSPDQYAMYFNCKTTLVDTFRTTFPNDFKFEGNRALVFDLADSTPQDALKYCIAAALRYRRKP